jgi:hypothetical protein
MAVSKAGDIRCYILATIAVRSNAEDGFAAVGNFRKSCLLDGVELPSAFAVIVEIRIYKTKSGLRDRFIDFVEHKSGPIQRHKGIQLFGPFVDLENEDFVVYLRGFPNLEERDRLRALFYKGPEWRGGLKEEAITMVDSYKVVLTKTTAHPLSLDD